MLVALHPLLRRAYERFALARPQAHGGQRSDQAAGEARLQTRLAFDFVTALVYIVALNGFSVFKILLILWINFKIGTGLPRNAIPAATWVFNIGILFANELTRGYRYSTLGQAMVPFFPAAADWGRVLDSYGGLNGRWEVLFKVTVLRLISFNFDYYWSLDRSRAGSPIEVCLRERTFSCHCMAFPLTLLRRNNSIRPHYLKETESICLPRRQPTPHFEYTSLTSSIHLCI